MDLTTRVSLVQNLLTTKEIPASVGAKLLDINRTSIYYKTSPVSDEELACKEIIDHLHTDNPTWGARQMSAQLKNRGYHVGRRKARRYMNEMDIYPIYPKMNLSKRVQQAMLGIGAGVLNAQTVKGTVISGSDKIYSQCQHKPLLYQ